MITVYYIGGPWDLHKVAEKQDPPQRITIVRMWEPAHPQAEVTYIDHLYTVRQLGKDVFAAIHSEILK